MPNVSPEHDVRKFVKELNYLLVNTDIASRYMFKVMLNTLLTT